jgi:hypothetical protein
MTPEAEATPLIYFISANAYEHPIKIGKTTGGGLHSRLTSLQIGTPKRLVILHLAEAPAAAERALHRDFRRYHVRGEWFEWARPLLDHIEDLELASGGAWRDKYEVRNRAFTKSVFGDGRGGRRNVNQMFGMGLSA